LEDLRDNYLKTFGSWEMSEGRHSSSPKSVTEGKTTQFSIGKADEPLASARKANERKSRASPKMADEVFF